jgi:hypothetical protein
MGDIGGAPEPAAWTMMIVGFGFAGAVVRRRRAMAPKSAGLSSIPVQAVAPERG